MKKVILKGVMKRLSRAMKTLLVLLFLNIVASSAYAQANDTSIAVIREGVEIIICFPDATIKKDTLSIEQWINNQPKDMEQRNKSLRQLNEKMKEPE